MPTYQFWVEYTYRVEVEAPTEQEARGKVDAMSNLQIIDEAMQTSSTAELFEVEE